MDGGRDYYAEGQIAALARRLLPTQLAKLAALEIALRERGVGQDDPRVPRYLAPLLGAWPQERVAAGAPASPIDGGRANDAFPISPENAIDWRWPARELRRLARSRAVSTYAAIGLFVLVLIGLAVYFRGSPAPDLDGNSLNASPPPIHNAIDGNPPPPTTDSKPLYLLNLAILAAALAIGGAAAAWPPLASRLRARRALRRRRQVARGSEPLVAASVRLAHARFFDDPAFAASLRKLRRYISIPSNRIDVTASIRASIANRIEPALRFATRKRSPDYVLLSEREQPGDHLAELAKAWRARLIEAQIPCAHYEFFGDPGTLRAVAESEGRIAAAPDRHEALDIVLLHHAGAHVVVMLESFDALPDPAAFPRWLASDRHETRLHLMNPRAARHWAAAEVSLAAMGISGFDATLEGSASFGDQVDQATDGADDRPDPIPEAPGDADLGAWLAAHRVMLMAQEPPTPRQVEILVDTLQRWLDLEAFDWLRALAVMPVISPGYTLFCGAVLKEESIVTHDRFLVLARLPWLRACRMPDWVRLALIGTLSPLARERAAATAAAFLDPPAGSADTAEQLLALRRSAESPQRRAVLARRLRQASHPVLNDRLLLDTLNGTAPDAGPLDLRVRDLFVAQALPWHRRRQAQAMLAVVPLVLLLVLQPASWREQGLIAYGSYPVERTSDAVDTVDTASDTAENMVDSATPPDEGMMQNSVDMAPADNAMSAAETGAVDTSAPSPDRVLTGGSATLYLQIADESQRARAAALRAQLSNRTVQGITLAAPGVELRGARSPDDTQLRCFGSSGCAFAQYLLPLIGQAGITARIVRFGPKDFTASRTLRENQVELWFGRNDGIVPVAPPTPPFDTGTVESGGSGLPPVSQQSVAVPTQAPPTPETSPSTAQPAPFTQILQDLSQRNLNQRGKQALLSRSLEKSSQTSPQPNLPTVGPFIVFFEYDRSEITPTAAAILDTVVTSFTKTGPYTVTIEAQGDAREADPTETSSRLANAVSDYLVGRGIPAAYISIAESASRPRVPAADGVRDPQSRRAEITLVPLPKAD